MSGKKNQWRINGIPAASVHVQIGRRTYVFEVGAAQDFLTDLERAIVQAKTGLGARRPDPEGRRT